MAGQKKEFFLPQIPVCLILVLSYSFFTEALYGSDSDVLQLTPDDFSEVTQGDSVVLVEFFAPWCGHCKSLAPAWEKAATALKGIVTVASVDCDAHQSLAQENGIQGFPTIQAYVPGKKSPVKFEGQRDVKGIVDFGLQQLKALVNARLGGKGGGSGGKSEGSASVELTDANFEEKVLESTDLWLVEFFAPWCGHCKNLAPEWKRAAKNLKGKVNLGQVDCTVHTTICSRFEVQGYPTIKIFGADKDKPTPYEGQRTAGAIESFALELLQANVPPPEVYEITGQGVFDERCGSAPICYVAILPDILDTGAEGRNKYIDMLRTVGDKFKKNRYSYVWAPAGAQPDLEKAVGIGGYGYPALVALNAKKGYFSPFKSSFQLEHLSDFIRSIGVAGGRGSGPLLSELKLVNSEPWDGLDGELPLEEEFDLNALMADDEVVADNTGKEEL